MKKISISIFIFLLLFCSFVYGLEFIVIKDTPYYDWRNGEKYVGELKEGEVVISNRRCFYHPVLSGYTPSFNIWFTENERYLIPVENIVPNNTKDLFGDDILFNYSIITVGELMPSVPSEMWVPSYYSDVLISRERNTLLYYEPRLAELNTGYEPMYDKDMSWYDWPFTNIDSGMSMLFNAALIIGRYCSLLIENIQKNDYGYLVHCLVVFTEETDGPNFRWELLKNGNYYDLLLYIDGDYMDIYVGGTEQKLGSLVRINEEFIRQYCSLISTNHCNLFNGAERFWPRRADGSMGPPKETPNITLTPKVLEESDTDVDAEDPQTIQNSAKKSAMPLWALFAIIGGAAAVAGAAVFIIRRKKS